MDITEGQTVPCRPAEREVKRSEDVVAVRLANMRQGARTDLSPIGGKSVSQSEAAELLKCGQTRPRIETAALFQNGDRH